MLLSRFSTGFTVRARLIVLSIIPVVGLAAIASAYLSSEHAVEKAFGSVQQSARMAEASRAFKDALTSMHMRAKDFVVQPQPALVARFNETHDAAIDSLKTLQQLVGEAERQNMTALQDRVANLKNTFAAIAASATTKQRLTDQVKAYTTAFAAWAASTEKLARSIAIISAETRQMLPAADEIIASATNKTNAAADGVAESQQQTKLLIFSIG